MITRVIASTPNVSAVLQDFGTSPIIVTFNEIGLRADGTRFWGKEMFGKLEISAIGVVSTLPNWYPLQDMEIVCEAIREETLGRVVITYGHSQGGYGALKFGSQILAERAFAFCPQISIDPADVLSFDRRFVQYHNQELKNGTILRKEDMPRESFIFYDPYETVDNEHVQRLQGYPGVRKVPVPFSGHDTIRLISESRLSGEFIGKVAFRDDDSTSLVDFRGLMRRARGGSETYFKNRFSVLLNKKSHLIATAKHRGIIDTDVVSLCSFAVAGDFPAAIQILSEITDDALAQANLLGLWKFFRALNFKTAEYRVSGVMRAKYPKDAFKRLHFVNSCINLGRLDKAREELEMVVLLPEAASFDAHIQQFRKSLSISD